MRLLLAAALSAAVLLTPAAGSGAATRSHAHMPACPPPHAHVLMSDGAAVLYTFERFSQDLFIEAACSHAHTSPYVLEQCESLDCGGPYDSDFVLEGNILAFQENDSGEDRYGITYGPRIWRIRVRNLRTGRAVHTSPTSTSPPTGGGVGNGPEEGLVAKSDGSVAWIAQDGWHLTGPPDTYQVWKFDRTGKHLLATGAHITPGSLALAGSTLYWMSEGVPSTASLD